MDGIADAIDLVVDDAIAVMEAIHARATSGAGPAEVMERGVGAIMRSLAGSSCTPVVVLLPLASLDGITEIVVRALAPTMFVALLTSLIMAITRIPARVVRLLRGQRAA